MTRFSADEMGGTMEFWFLGEIYKDVDFSKILGMALPGVGGVPAPRESSFCVCPASQLPYMEKSENPTIYYNIFLYIYNNIYIYINVYIYK